MLLYDNNNNEVLRRLTSKCISRVVNAVPRIALPPLQVGVGVSVGCETIVHAVTNVHNDNKIFSESKWTLLSNFPMPSIVSIVR